MTGLTTEQELELVAGHTAKSITDEDLTALYAIADRQADLLRHVRLVTEQLARTADDIDPRHHPDEVRLAETKAIRAAVAAVTGALDGAGRHIPDPRGNDHHSDGWTVPCTEERTR